MRVVAAIAVVCVIAIVWLVRRRSANVYVLEARVGTLDGIRYSVVFTELHPETKPVEYVWLCLLVAAKLLYNIGNSQKEAEARALLLRLIAIPGDTDLCFSGDLAHATGQPILVLGQEAKPRARCIVAKVGYLSPVTRLVWTSLPYTWFEQQFPHSFLALVQASLPRLDTMLRRRLQGSLARMTELYGKEGRNPASLNGLKEVPHVAFFDAKVIA